MQIVDFLRLRNPGFRKISERICPMGKSNRFVPEDRDDLKKISQSRTLRKIQKRQEKLAVRANLKKGNYNVF